MIVQTNHATQQLFSILPSPEGIPNIVAIGVPDEAALKRVFAKLKANQIQHRPFYEPDGDLGFTAIVTVPLDGVQREALRNYRLFNGRGHEQVSSCAPDKRDSPTIPPEANSEMNGPSLQ